MFVILGYSRKYPYMCVPYHGWLYGIPRVRGGFFELEIQGHWGILMIGINESGGEGLDLEFPQGTDKSEFLENAYFMDLISSKIKHELTRLLTTAGARYKTSIHQSGNVGCT